MTEAAAKLKSDDPGTPTTIDIRDLPTRFQEALAQLAAGAEVIVTEGNVSRARLAPLLCGHPRVAGLHPGAISTSTDSDVPLPDDFWAGTP
jgi:antitoxin (DNA-binding transcriptional repressor) of toxin-antitoxin stability system